MLMFAKREGRMLQLRTSCTTRSKVDGVAGENYKGTAWANAKVIELL
jgi:hypothetical protein